MIKERFEHNPEHLLAKRHLERQIMPLDWPCPQDGATCHPKSLCNGLHPGKEQEEDQKRPGHEQ